VAFIIVLVAMLVFMYFLLIRPQRAKQRQAQELLSSIKPGDEIITIGGIYGDVVEVEEDKVTLEIAEDVHIEVTRRAIANIVPPETGELEETASEDGEDAEEGEEGEPEASVEPEAEEPEAEEPEAEPTEPVQERAR
jgi:preprotein translocase subunit YajC